MSGLDLIAEIRSDHRKARDRLLEVVDALDSRDSDRVRDTFARLDGVIGPHFWFEGEALFPAVRAFLTEYINDVLDSLDELLDDREKLIRAMRSSARLIEEGPFEDDVVAWIAHTVRTLLVYVSACDRVAVLAERLRPKEIEQLAETYAATRRTTPLFASAILQDSNIASS